MKCPALFVGRPLMDPEEDTSFGACLKDGCAWWDELKNCCSVKVIARELSYIQRKMDYEKSFVK
ncbi:hypothetical protein LCGC14_0848540 [marine sediment metagenome]|uniref:Uncharacterized protein n=1 Tax=marine sediment metagenome TaxID=412755 RepID=A0A0F9SI20_9ZZZZ